MSICPAGLQRLSFDVIRPAFSCCPPPVAAQLDIGAAVRKLSRFAVLSVLEKQAAPGAACWKKDRQPVRALVASSMLRRRDPGTGFGVVALEGSLDSPARPGPRRKSS